MRSRWSGSVSGRTRRPQLQSHRGSPPVISGTGSGVWSPPARGPLARCVTGAPWRHGGGAGSFREGGRRLVQRRPWWRRRGSSWSRTEALRQLEVHGMRPACRTGACAWRMERAEVAAGVARCGRGGCRDSSRRGSRTWLTTLEPRGSTPPPDSLLARKTSDLSEPADGWPGWRVWSGAPG